ncbi:glutathione S-transferase family protein [Yoonia sp. 208BN28-4]|uniref:glutathione S-transferase family protein n=1 Tax=Yoonia sp. 208BN28-4 TaxID=3126505 RepID=UPI0030B17760
MKLHYSPGTISIAVAIALEETDTPYEAIRVDFASGAQQGEAYRAINPKGRVPALETPQGIITETGAVLEYAAPALVPDDAYQAARMREAMYYLASTMHVAHAHKMRGHRWADEQSSFDDMKAKVPQNMADCCAYLEDQYPFDPCVLGDDFTLADAYMTVVLGWLEGDGVDITIYPKLAAYLIRMRTRPSVLAVMAKGMLS